MPDGEGAVVGDGVEQIAAVWTDAWVADGGFCLLRVNRSTLYEGVDLGAYGSRLFVEGYADEGIL